MAKKKDVNESIEIIESPEALQHELEKVTGFFDQNKSTVIGAAVLVVAIIVGYFGFHW